MPYPSAENRTAVVRAFFEGNLAARLTALELLGPWKAPLGDLDPWVPETVKKHQGTLEKWAAEAKRTITMGGMTNEQFRLFILKEVMKVNEKLGLLYITASGLVDIFQGTSFLHPDDIVLACASIDDFVAKTKELAGIV